MTDKPLLSIIIPVYNVENYIDECLQSIINQTFKDYEIILVDDGSPDNCPKICDDYAQKYNFIKAIHKENGGQSSARNCGLDNAIGEYVFFVDSDDWIARDSLKKIVECLEEKNVDLIMWTYSQEFDNKSINRHIFYSNKQFGYNECNDLRRLIIGPIESNDLNPQSLDKLSTVWSKLYRLDVIKDNSIYFYDSEKIGTFEDGLFNFEYFKYIKSAYYLDECLYCYRKTNASSLTSIVRLDLFDKWMNLFECIQEIILNEKLDNSYKKALENRIVISLYSLIYIAGSSSLVKNEKIDLVKKLMENDIFEKALENFEIKEIVFPWNIYFGLIKKHRIKTLFLFDKMIKFLLKMRK